MNWNERTPADLSPDPNAQCQQNESRQQTEPRGDFPIPHARVDVELQPSQKDDIKHAETADRVKRFEAGQNVEHVRANQRPTQQQAHQAGQSDPLRDQRAEHDDQRNDSESEGG